MVGFMEFLGDCLREVVLTEEDGQHIWRFDASGSYSTKFVYRAYFTSSVTFEPWRRLWKSWAPGKCKFFIWLAIRNRCWMADRLACRGLSHLEKCSLVRSRRRYSPAPIGLLCFLVTGVLCCPLTRQAVPGTTQTT